MNPFDLSGRVAVVTGGNGGLGLGMAAGLARAGCAVSVWGRNDEKNAFAVETLREIGGGEVEALACDVTDEASVGECMAATLARFGRVDGMFANAGHGGGAKPSADRTAAEWRALMAVNLDGVVNCFQAATRHMVERSKAGEPFGRLVATSSVAGLEGAAYNEHYGASKGAVNAYVRALAVELARHGITVNAILPGWCESEMTADTFANEKFVANVMPRIPARRFGRPDDFEAVSVYLMSEGSAYQTGQPFVLDGGYTIF
ncbi:MAG TPA: SDR family NAD(P)-dependent oxidoreductase [Paracoccaceae bacterium]|nr:SDR family NAD(P)-dependent oxidoreductase [Paracoccaceae bacterium]